MTPGRSIIVVLALAAVAAAALLVDSRRDADGPALAGAQDGSDADVDPDVMYAACDRALFVAGSREEH